MAGTVNRVILIGRLGKDPEIKYTPSGTAMATFSLATDENRKDAEGNRQQVTEWHNLILWGKQAEIAGEYLRKGRLIYVEGRIQTRSWDDAQSHEKRYRTEVVGERFVMLGGRPDQGESQEAAKVSAPQPTQTAPEARLEDEEDLPF